MKRAAGGLFGLVAVALVLVYGVSEFRLRSRIEIPAHAIAVPSDSAAIARGRHVADVRGCTSCHGPSLGGSVRLENVAIGRVSAPNLTNGGRGAALTDQDWERAVRHGVRRDSRPLLFMPAADFAQLADDELAAVVAFARSLPASPAALPPSSAGPVARALLVGGSAAVMSAGSIDHRASHPTVVTPGATVAYGRYLATACASCHRAGFEGGPVPGAPPSYPPAANLTPAGIGRWSYDDFVQALRGGRRPNGAAIRPPMPLKITRAMTDVEVAALWTYLRSLPARTGT
ncbi:MAG TPA: cytochrome c [Gemmatimonadaceae bacterium]|nr:cytochrome c [Gemmatimonadaceae bacterium]